MHRVPCQLYQAWRRDPVPLVQLFSLLAQLMMHALGMFKFLWERAKAVLRLVAHCFFTRATRKGMLQAVLFQYPLAKARGG
jgi:hypothetical protein